MRRPPNGGDDDFIIIYRAWRRTRDGRVLWARKYGLKSWPIRVPRRPH